MLDSPCVTTSTGIAPQNNAKELTARIGWLVLICATLYVCYFSHLGAIGFVGPDEPRYAWIARDMAESGDWITPRLYGKPWFEKPPLYYWGAAVSFKLFGVSEAAARLPSAISALLATLAMAWLAWRVYDAETARWLLLLLPTTVGMIGFSHAAATDMPFSAMLTMAMVCAAVVVGLVPERSSQDGAQHAAPLRDERDAAPQRGWLALILFGFFLGLAVLAKGPAGIILCGGAVFFWALFAKRWREALRLFQPAAIAAFCATALPWYILVARRNPDFFRIFIIEHNFKRYLTPEFQHIQPFWFYVPVLCIALMPWTFASFILAMGGARRWQAGDRRNSRSLFLVSWVLVPIIFFSISKSKLPGYVLPAIFPLGLLVASALSVRIHRTLAEGRWICVSIGLTLITIGILAFLQIESISFGWAPVVLTAGGIAVLMLGLGPQFATALLTGVGTVVATILVAFAGSTGKSLDQRLSVRPSIEAAAIVWKDFSPEQSSTYRLQRSFQFALNSYFHREVPEWSPDSRRGWVFAPHSEITDLRKRGLNCPVVFWYAVTVCEDTASPANASGSRQPQ
jgi:4-amino-4-deoxy-L-arabinose transferase-like glycosyltransferase